jgi:thiamine biosynthesis lipoprotein
MGTEVRLVLYAPDRDVADAAASRAFVTVTRLDSLFSDYRPDSEVAKLAATAGSGEDVAVSPELIQVLAAARDWTRRTDGAFDVAMGPLTRLWRRAIRNGELPDSARLGAARALSGSHGLVVDTAAGTARLERPGMGLDLGGIAKGYVAEAVLDGLRADGVDIALVDAGGDLALGAPPPQEAGWQVEFPGAEVHRLASTAVATSGDRYQYLEVEGVRYSHILDPRTGLGIAASPTVVVVAPDAMTADVLASALTVLAPGPGRALAASISGAAVRVDYPASSGESWETDGFPLPPDRRPSQESGR